MADFRGTSPARLRGYFAHTTTDICAGAEKIPVVVVTGRPTAATRYSSESLELQRIPDVSAPRDQPCDTLAERSGAAIASYLPSASSVSGIGGMSHATV